MGAGITKFSLPAPIVAPRVMKNGHQMWQWVILEFMDESFTEYIDPVELALTREGLYCEE